MSDTGLNQYVLLVAGTGRGKEGARGGVQRFIAHACSDSWHDDGNSRQMHADHIIPLSYIQQRLLQHRAFMNDRTKANDALKRTIQSFIDAGDLQELGRGDFEKYGKRGKAYGTSNAACFVKMAEPEPTDKGKAAFFDAPPSG